MMRINDGPTQRVDMNANFEPWINDTYNLGGITGGSEYRWATLFTTNIDTTNAVNVTSDKRLKANIADLDYGLSEVIAMRPVSYNMKKSNTKQVHIGLIAQEVEMIIPEVVSQKDDAKHTRSMRYSELIPVLIKATQEQQLLIDQQANDLLQQNQLIKQQTKDIQQLKILVKALIK